MVSVFVCARVRVAPFFLHVAVRAVPSCQPDVRVLRRDARMRRSRDFRETVSQGNRAGRPRVVLHVLYGQDSDDSVPNVGFVVSSAVGGSVVRHRVTRQLRHIMWARLDVIPSGSRIVVRALPASATATSVELEADVDKALKRLGMGVSRD
jgi:ribonuclease P protein component